MPVTPVISPVDRNFEDHFPDVPGVARLFPKPGHHPDWLPRQATKTQLVGFVDWLSIYQRHGSGLPVLSDGAFVRFDADGQQLDTKLCRYPVRGSYETAIFLRCDGETVWFDGNVSKFSRPDNVFGFTFREALIKVNRILLENHLPPFSEGQRFITNLRGNPRSEWTGAVITRVDITQNFSAGSKEDASYFMAWLQGQQASRLKTGTYADGETVDFGRGSQRVYSKAYLKASEIRKRSGGDPYLERLADWCDSVGLIRFETTYKSNQLRYLGCRFLGGFDMKQLEIDFEERKEVLSRGSVELEDFSQLPKHILGTYRMWLAGDDLSTALKRTQFYVHRKALLPYGVDIAVKSNVKQFPQKTRVIKLGPVSPPDFYELPKLEGLKNGTYC